MKYSYPDTLSPLFLHYPGQSQPQGAYVQIDGDTHDLRFLDPEGVVVGLRAKGKAKTLRSDFVVAV